MSREKRPTRDYLEDARRLAPYAPVLKKYKRRKTLRPQEKSAITRKAKLLRFAENIIPITLKQAREMKEIVYRPPVPLSEKQIAAQKRYRKQNPGKDLPRELQAPHADYSSRQGITALQLNNTGRVKKLKVKGRDLYLQSNGRQWMYWRLDRNAVNKRGLKKAAEQAFANQFPIETIAKLAGVAFRQLKPVQVYLWTTRGRRGEPFEDLDSFLEWLNREWNATNYKIEDADQWINGLAILLHGPLVSNKQEVEDYEEDDETEE